MGTLKIGGKDAKSTARKTRTPPKPQTQSPLIDPAWGEVNADPFPVDQQQPAELRASYVADAAIWITQHVEETAKLARKYDRLLRKLHDPALANNPNRPDAVKKAGKIEADLIQSVRDIVMDEGLSDRVWQSLEPDERASAYADFHWGVDRGEPRLIGKAWTAIGRHVEWPMHFRLMQHWFRGLPAVVLMDLRKYRVYAWQPNPPPHSVFDETRNDAVPDDIRKDALKGKLS